MRQLPLGVQLRVMLRFASFDPGASPAAVGALQRAAAGAGPALLWLHGPPGVGRTHLLQATCADAGEHGRRVAYLPLAELRDQPADLLAGLEDLDLVALDDLQQIAGRADWEGALFTLYNDLSERRGSLVCAADAPPAGLPFALRDLASRLAALTVFRLQPLSEAQQAGALRRRAGLRGLELPDEVLQYLLRRAPRDFAALCRLLDELDTEALAARRRLTVPFVRTVLARGPD
ncbi:MAG: DnaA regulatory inactivator Hda [Gammaproteobacteria bacterium]|nr:DnaA regulatory inactivator Hda [Gammaproteobacteria bacterium]